MRFGVVVFPGSNCDEDAYHAAKAVFGQDAEYLWHKDTDLKGAEVLILPGGFAHGDYLRTGAMARFSPIMREVKAFADRGGPVLGICNGFQILLESGLLPGAMLRNRNLKYRCEHVHVRVEETDTPFTSATRAGQVLRIPIGHGEGNYFAPPDLLGTIEANRQVILHRIREVFSQVFGRSAEDLEMRMVYDVSHNTAKLERHVVDGKEKTLLVHRKGATRAFGPGHEEVAARYREIGQPVIIGGSMETGSYLLVGTASGAETFFSTAHGSGRTMSRTKARKQWHGKQLQRDLEARGIYVRSTSWAGLAEEAGPAYKDIDEVIAATELAGISKPVVRFTPIGNVKG